MHLRTYTCTDIGRRKKVEGEWSTLTLTNCPAWISGNSMECNTNKKLSALSRRFSLTVKSSIFFMLFNEIW